MRRSTVTILNGDTDPYLSYLAMQTSAPTSNTHFNTEPHLHTQSILSPTSTHFNIEPHLHTQSILSPTSTRFNIEPYPTHILILNPTSTQINIEPYRTHILIFSSHTFYIEPQFSSENATVSLPFYKRKENDLGMTTPTHSLHLCT